MIFFLTDGCAEKFEFARGPQAVACPHCNKAAVLLPMVVANVNSLYNAAEQVVCQTCKKQVLQPRGFEEHYRHAVSGKMAEAIQNLITCPINPDCPQKAAPPSRTDSPPWLEHAVTTVLQRQEELTMALAEQVEQQAEIGILVHRDLLQLPYLFAKQCFTLLGSRIVTQRCPDCKSFINLPTFVLAAVLVTLKREVFCNACAQLVMTNQDLKNCYAPSNPKLIKEQLLLRLNVKSPNVPVLAWLSSAAASDQALMDSITPQLPTH